MAKKKIAPKKKKRPTASAAKGVAKVTKTADLAPEIVGSEEQYNRFLPSASKVAPSEIVTCRADVHLLHHNLQRGATAVLARRDDLKKELPKMALADLDSLIDLSRALVFAAARVDQVLTPSETRALLAQARTLRRMLLASAESVAHAGLLPEAAVDKIRAGKGAIDAAQDCVALAALFTKYPAARAKTPVTSAQVKQASELGTKLLDVLKPKGTPRSRPAEVKAAAQERDSLYSLLLQRHDQLWRAGAVLFGRDAVESEVPPLSSRTQARAKKPAPPVVAPTPAVTS